MPTQIRQTTLTSQSLVLTELCSKRAFSNSPRALLGKGSWEWIVTGRSNSLLPPMMNVLSHPGCSAQISSWVRWATVAKNHATVPAQCYKYFPGCTLQNRLIKMQDHPAQGLKPLWPVTYCPSQLRVRAPSWRVIPKGTHSYTEVTLLLQGQLPLSWLFKIIFTLWRPSSFCSSLPK